MHLVPIYPTPRNFFFFLFYSDGIIILWYTVLAGMALLLLNNGVNSSNNDNSFRPGDDQIDRPNLTRRTVSSSDVANPNIVKLFFT